MQFLNIALASLGESVSAIHAYLAAGQLTDEQFNNLDEMSYAVENQLLALIRSLKKKKASKDWNDDYNVREEVALYGEAMEDA